MRGFKSFADNTAIDFEPGVTAIVGPNGSGKSNVVDAVTWVLGAQSTRALRSAKMDDVIFAGTGSRPALGRAEVSLTLDNASGRLGIDGAEVTIGRTLFRNGESEYAINGAVCRLLDIQELLGDSGVGRQQHMIIGQGQLDAVLSASPESRRAIIEEAAGVLKHRRRKERAERRLAQTQENLERLGDLVRELRRQMRPLERQAASARSYVEIERSLDEARGELYQRRRAELAARETVLEAADREAGADQARLASEMAALEEASAAATAEMSSGRGESLATTLGEVRRLGERSRGVASVIAERQRATLAALDAAADVNVVATLEADEARLVRDLAEVVSDEEAIAPARATLAARQRDLAAQRAELETAIAPDTSVESAAVALRERVAAAERALVALEERRQRVERRRDDLSASVAADERARTELDEQMRVATARVASATHAVAEARAELARVDERAAGARGARDEARAEAARAQARAEALAHAYQELSGAASREVLEDVAGVVGALLDVIDVDPTAVRAVDAAVGASLGATVMAGPGAARTALERLRDVGDVGLVLTSSAPVAPPPTPEDCEPVRALVRSRTSEPAVDRLLDSLLTGAVVAPSWERALELAATRPDLVVVTREGDRLARSGWRVGTGHAAVTRVAVEQAEAAAAAAAGAAQGADATATEAEAQLASQRGSLAAAERAEVEARSRTAQLEAERRRLDERQAEAAVAVAAVTSEAREIETRTAEVAGARDADRDALPAIEQRAEEAAAQRAARATAGERLRTLEEVLAGQLQDLARREAAVAERRSLIEQRRGELERRLHGHADEREVAAKRRQGLEADQRTLVRLAEVVAALAVEVERLQRVLDTDYRAQLEVARAGAAHLESLRTQRQELDQRLVVVRDAQRHAQVELAELHARRAALEEAVARDRVDTAAAREPDPATPTPELESRVGELEARRSALGPINPLALDELAELEERHRMLDEQVADVRRARHELQEVVRAVDDEIMTTFSSAVADVNEHFATLVTMLFPGGQGRLTLTDPDDPLNTGVEIEVRPMGRNVRRISLLSGGERSMAALAFLFAVFRSRPSPFYLMDEVEAALDDVNLQRFLGLIDEFRTEAQLLVVTHQKRTMEAADALYGVTMVPGGSSKVVSQRVTREVVA